MEEKSYTLNIRQVGKFQFEVAVPETGATKTAPTLDSALTITLHDILKHLTTRYLILVFAEQLSDTSDRSVNSQDRLQTDLEHQAALAVVRLCIALQIKRRERHLVFELSGPLTREQNAWLDEQTGKLFDKYYIKDELEVELEASREEARDHRKAAAHE